MSVSMGVTTTEAQPTTYEGYFIDYTNNFIDGATYTQYDIGTETLTWEQVLAICMKYANETNAHGFFY